MSEDICGFVVISEHARTVANPWARASGQTPPVRAKGAGNKPGKEAGGHHGGLASTAMLTSARHAMLCC